jgi:hypothetical protein
MPSLKDLNCSIELSDNQRVLQEFGTIYGDGFVETFVPVPGKPQSFSGRRDLCLRRRRLPMQSQSARPEAAEAFR